MSLPTLNYENMQDAFDKVVRHLRTQRVQATDDFGFCRYRGREGTKCAIGALIDDEDYVQDCEARSVLDITKWYWINPKDLPLLGRLQSVHDCMDGEYGRAEESKLISIALEFDLSNAALTEALV